MRPRGWFASALVTAAVVVGFLLWDRGDPEPAPEQPQGSTPDAAKPVEPALEARGSKQARAPGATAPRKGPPWYFDGTVESMRKEVQKTRVIAHWWPEKPNAGAPPVETFESAELDLSRGPASFHLQGHADGFVRLFLLQKGRLHPFNPWVARPGHEVRGGGGLGVGAGHVGTHAFHGRAVNKEGDGVSDIRLVVRDPVKGSPQAAITDAEGRFFLAGFHADAVTVTYSERSTYAWTAEYAGFEDRRVELREGEIPLHIPRNPIVVPLVGATLGGTFYRAAPRQFSTTKIRADGTEQLWSSPDLWGREPVLHLTPGGWRLHHRLYSATSSPVETGVLELDQEVEITFEARFEEKAVLVGVHFDVVPDEGEDPLRCAAEGKGLASGRGWTGPRGSAPGSRVLLIFAPGRYAVVGAIGRGDTVRLSHPVVIDLKAGSSRELLLRTDLAGGIRFPAVPRRHDGVNFLRLKERDFPGHGVVDGRKFSMAWLANRRHDTTWWMHPGAYTVQRQDQSDRVIEAHAVKVKAGLVRAFEETEAGLKPRE